MKVCVAFFLCVACIQFCPAQSTSSTDSVPQLHHIDVTQVDSSIDPCENFYQHVCGKLNAENPIPAVR